MTKCYHTSVGMLNPEETDIVKILHSRHSVGECPWCDFIRVRKIAKEFERRIDICDERIQSLNMWSLGTSLTDTPLNRKTILHWWRVFTRRLDRNSHWAPLFRVLEVGRRGFLHFHVVCSQYISHAEVLRVWRSITGENSNVHVSSSNKEMKTSTLIRYLIKYLTKESSSYRWMGSLYGLGRATRGRVLEGPSERLVYGGAMCYEQVTEGYQEKADPQSKL